MTAGNGCEAAQFSFCTEIGCRPLEQQSNVLCLMPVVCS